MKLLPITNRNKTIVGYTQVDDDVWQWARRCRWCFKDNTHTYVQGYGTGTKPTSLHRQIVEAQKGDLVDHIDRNTLNNQLMNLRIVDKRTSNLNRGFPKNNKSGYIGVSFDKVKRLWVAQATIYNKKIWIGRYTTPEKAHQAYLEVTSILSEE